MSTREEKMEAFGGLLDVMEELREKCPWDRKQTNESLRANTIEETYELCDAIIRDDNNEIKKELGDLLLHVVFYSKIERSRCSTSRAYATVFASGYRHPHVFGDAVADTAKGGAKLLGTT